VDLRFSLNTLSKLREFNTEFCTIDKPRALYLLAYRKPKSAEIWTLAVEHPDGLLLLPFRNSAIISLSGPHPEHWNILKCWTVSGRVATSSGRLVETFLTV